MTNIIEMTLCAGPPYGNIIIFHRTTLNIKHIVAPKDLDNEWIDYA